MSLRHHTIRFALASLLSSTYFWLPGFNSVFDSFNADEDPAQAQELISRRKPKAIHPLLQQGLQHYEQQQYRSALKTFQTLWEENKTLSKQEKATVLDYLGRSQIHTFNSSDAIEPLENALQIYRKRKDQSNIASVLVHLGWAHTVDGFGYESTSFLDEAIKIYQSLGDRKGEAEALHFKGLSQSIGSRLLPALRTENPPGVATLFQALKLRRAVSDRQGEARTLSTIGGVYNDLENYSEALRQLQQALKILQEIGDHHNELFARWRLTDTYVGEKEFPKAIAMLKSTITLAQTHDFQDAEVLSWLELGRVYQANQDTENAIAAFTQSFDLAQKISRKSSEASSLMELGELYKETQEIEKAIDSLRQATLINWETQGRVCQSNENAALGDTYNRVKYSVGTQEDAKAYAIKAIQEYNQALDIERSHNNTNCELSLLSELASIYSHEDYPKLLDIANRTLELASDLSPESLEENSIFEDIVRTLSISSSRVAIDSPKTTIDLAKLNHQIALKLNSPYWVEQTLLKIGERYGAIGDITNAKQYYRQGILLEWHNRQRQCETDDQASNAIAYMRFAEKHKDSLKYIFSQDYKQAIQTLELTFQTEQQQKDVVCQLFLARDLIAAYPERANFKQITQTLHQIVSITDKINLDDPRVSDVAAFLQVYLQDNMSAISTLLWSDRSNTSEDEQRVVQFYLDLIKIAQDFDSADLELQALSNLGKIYSALGNYQAALQTSQEGAKQSRNQGFSIKEADFLSSQGSLYSTLGDYSNSKQVYQQALKIYRQYNNLAKESESLTSIGFIDFVQGNNPTAMAKAKQSLQRLDDLQKVNLSIDAPDPLEQKLSKIYPSLLLSRGQAGMGDYQQAIRTLNLNLDHIDEAQAFMQLVVDKLNSSSYQEIEALNTTFKSITLFLNFTKQFVLSERASSYYQSGNRNQAIADYQHALSTHSPQILSTENGAGFLAHLGLARIYRDLNRPTISIVQYKKTIQGIESFRTQLKGLSLDLQASYLNSLIGIERTKVSDIFRDDNARIKQT